MTIDSHGLAAASPSVLRRHGAALRSLVIGLSKSCWSGISDGRFDPPLSSSEPVLPRSAGWEMVMDGTGKLKQNARRHAGGGIAADAGTKIINLALQGGGAHGAFTWGVLDQLLEDERIVVEGISATSAGAMNAAVFTYGYAMGGRAGAKTALE